jgi:hypothetical protein
MLFTLYVKGKHVTCCLKAGLVLILAYLEADRKIYIVMNSIQGETNIVRESGYVFTMPLRLEKRVDHLLPPV